MDGHVLLEAPVDLLVQAFNVVVSRVVVEIGLDSGFRIFVMKV